MAGVFGGAGFRPRGAEAGNGEEAGEAATDEGLQRFAA